MKSVLRALLIAVAATAVVAAAIATTRRRPVAALARSASASLYVDADAMTEAERQALRSELEGMV
ncbi:MAG: hypothetical protein SH809_20650 [Rhodothermales bacterium]|nr:hypothetical protein [Rhodothermales bacterium]